MIKEFPHKSILGLSYSGMHDSAISIVGPDGTPYFSCSLERVSRSKQDGRPPFALIENLPWKKIDCVAISTEKSFLLPHRNSKSKLFPENLSIHRSSGLEHKFPFYQFIESIPVEKKFVCHQLAHAASAFWASGYESSLCLTYDGGMSNSPWFGGLYSCNRKNGIQALDRFSALDFSKITTLYTFVTALLGFTPNKHEGKITGLAAYGQPNKEIIKILMTWLQKYFIQIESTMEWVNAYDLSKPPFLMTHESKIEPYRSQIRSFSKEDVAASVQELAELHVLEILANAKKFGWSNENICLAGGLFSNVKINQKIAEAGFSKLFVAPPMTDDGTSLGAAWQVLSERSFFNPSKLNSIYLGPYYDEDHIEPLLLNKGIAYDVVPDSAETIAQYLSQGKVVGVFQGAMEFGPRALGNRSIIAQATDVDINQNLNTRLNRTEFMPFAPISRVEDAKECYLDIEKVIQAAEFMTVTVQCTERLKELCPAVVHKDGTARPQLVTRDVNPLVHKILTIYNRKTGIPALVNTSFNIHEEPIVCTPEDTIKGFFEGGLDYLSINGKYLISFEQNKSIAISYLREKIRTPNKTYENSKEIIRYQSSCINELELELALKENEIQKLRENRTNSPKDLLIAEQARALEAYRIAYGGFSLLAPVVRNFRRLYYSLRPRLGNLRQYDPRELTELNLQCFPKEYPLVSIVTPSFNQGEFIGKTVDSVLLQHYPNVEYFIQDGGSTDATISLLKNYGDKISWESDKDEGQANALNRGFIKCRGEIMCWINSDDLLLPGALNVVVDFFNRNPDVDVLYGNRLLIDRNDKEIGRWILPKHDDEVLTWVDYVPQETLFWRRGAWEKSGGQIDESFHFALDWDLLIRFRDTGANIEHMPEFLGAFRVHENQKTSMNVDLNGHQEMNRIRKRILGRVPTQHEIRRRILPYVVRHIFLDLKFKIKHKLFGGL